MRYPSCRLFRDHVARFLFSRTGPSGVLAICRRRYSPRIRAGIPRSETRPAEAGEEPPSRLRASRGEFSLGLLHERLEPLPERFSINRDGLSRLPDDVTVARDIAGGGVHADTSSRR